MSIFLHHVLYIICSKAKIPHTHTHTNHTISPFCGGWGGGGRVYKKEKNTMIGLRAMLLNKLSLV